MTPKPEAQNRTIWGYEKTRGRFGLIPYLANRIAEGLCAMFARLGHV
jgi:hypothetical protein